MQKELSRNTTYVLMFLAVSNNYVYVHCMYVGVQYESCDCHVIVNDALKYELN